MRDKRPVDELSIEELERILAIRKREARQAQLDRMKRSGRVVSPAPVQPPIPSQHVAKPEATPAPASQNAPPQNSEPVLEPEPIDPIEAALFPDRVRPQQEQPVAKSANGKATIAQGKSKGAPRFEDEVTPFEVEEEERRIRADSANRIWKRFANASLLLVEVVAVAGLIFLGVNMLGAIDMLQDETRAAQQMANATRQATIPTIAPTPALRLDQVVLPGGHTIDPVTNTVDFNYDEIPAHLLPMVRSQIRQPVIERPEITEEDALRVIISRLNLDEAIVPGTDFEALKMGVGRELNGARPGGTTGNVVLAAHNDVYGELFRHLDELEPGDRFQIQTQTRTHTYVITHWELVEPNDVHVMEDQGRPTATLISCYPYMVNNKRIVVFAERIDL